MAVTGQKKTLSQIAAFHTAVEAFTQDKTQRASIFAAAGFCVRGEGSD